MTEEKKYSSEADCRKAKDVSHCCICSTADCTLHESRESKDVATTTALSFGSPKESGVLDFQMWGVVV